VIGNDRFTAKDIDAVYDAIFKRRDVRNFEPADISDELIYKLLKAAHHAPSVGFMQPWNFIVIRNPKTKKKVKECFERENRAASNYLTGERKKLYDSVKLEGIMESPVNICVTCDPTRSEPFVIGRHSMRETDEYSVCCAIENFWLAARAEGIGVGWVSILRKDTLRQILEIPGHIVPIAYLCVGTPKKFYDKPELETVGWRKRLPINDLVFLDRWKNVWNNNVSASTNNNVINR